MKLGKIILSLGLLLSLTWVLAQSINELIKKGNDKFKNGDYNGSLKAFNEALEENKNSAEAYRGRARTKRFLSNLNGALSDYNSALNLNPNVANSYLGRAQTHLKSGSYEEAIKDYNTFLNLNPSSDYTKAILYNRAVAKNNLKDFEGALTDYNAALKIEPNDIKSLVNRGLIKYSNNEIRDACADWLKAKALGNEKAARNVARACQCCM